MQTDQAAPLQVKKLYVLAAFEVEKARLKNEAELTRAHGLTTLGGGFAAGATMTAATRAQATLQGLVTRDAQASQVRPWLLAPIGMRFKHTCACDHIASAIMLCTARVRDHFEIVTRE
jgi:hypothetical protein